MPPLSLTTTLTRVSVAAWSLLLIVQVTLPPLGTATVRAGEGAAGAGPRGGGVAGRAAGLAQHVVAGA